MSTFNEFIEFIKAMGPATVQYGRNGVIDSCGHGAQRDAATLQLTGFETPAGHRAPELEVVSGASGKDFCGPSAEGGKASNVRDARVEGLGAGTVVADNSSKTAVNTARTSGCESHQNCDGLGAEWGIQPAGSAGRLDAMAGRVPSLSVELSYICEGPDCYRVIVTSFEPLRCELCADRPVFCSECWDLHQLEGHVSDSDTAREMERSR